MFSRFRLRIDRLLRPTLSDRLGRMRKPRNRRGTRQQDSAQFEILDQRILLCGASCTATIDVGDLGKGIAASDSDTSTGFLLFSEESVHARFGGLISTSASHLISARNNGGQWQYNNNNAWLNFSPEIGDRLLATIDFGQDSIVSLQGQSGKINGIDQGYIDGDLTFFANSWNGNFNFGEFEVNGTFFTAELADLNDQISEVSTVAIGTQVIESFETTNDVDLFAIDVEAGYEVSFEIQSPDSPFDPGLRLFDSSGNELNSDVRIPASQTTRIDSGSIAGVYFDENGEVIIDIDLDARKVVTSNEYYVSPWGSPTGIGSASDPFDHVSTAIAALNENDVNSATLWLTAGEFHWGDILPEFDMNLIGKGIGQSIIRGVAGENAAKSRRQIDMYFEGLSFLGGENAIDLRNGGLLTLREVEVAESFSRDGADLHNFDTIVVYNSIARDNWKDGFSYHNPKGNPMDVLEYNVQANDNGKEAVFHSQGSTTHNSVDITRVNSQYLRNRANITDVSSGSSWNINITTADPQDPKDFNFKVSGGGTAWLISGDHSQGGNLVTGSDPGSTLRYSSLIDFEAHTTEQLPGTFIIGPDDSLFLTESLPDEYSLPKIQHTFNSAGTYYLGVSHANNMNYDPVSGDDDTTGTSGVDYLLDITPVNVPGTTTTGNIGNTFSGIAVDDSTPGEGYIMYSAAPVVQRFSIQVSGNSEHLIAVRNNGGGWEYNNNVQWLPFTPAEGDRLLASVHFSADTISSLQGFDGQVSGIDRGFLSGDLTFSADSWKGSFNNGEFQIEGTSFTYREPDLDDQISEASLLQIGDVVSGGIGDGVDVDIFAIQPPVGKLIGLDVDSADGSFDSAIRLFDSSGNELATNDDDFGIFPELSNHEAFLAYTFTTPGTYYVGISGQQNTSYSPFNSTGDTPNSSSGNYNFTYDFVTGADRQNIVSLGLVNGGIAVNDLEVGTGYIMFSEQPVADRFSAAPPFTNNSSNMIAVRYQNGWQYNNNNGWVAFSPAQGDRLLAAVDFANDTMTSLQGQVGQVNGINQGYVNGDLEFLPNQWNGKSNRGEFTVSGSYFEENFEDANDQISEASVVSAGTIQDTLDAGTDVDLFAIDVFAGQTLRFDIDSTDGNFDSYLRLFDGSGNELSSSDDDTGLGTEYVLVESYIQYTFSTSGRYYIGVSGYPNLSYDVNSGLGDDSNGFVGSYELVIS